jgi:hypothetical protein
MGVIAEPRVEDSAQQNPEFWEIRKRWTEPCKGGTDTHSIGCSAAHAGLSCCSLKTQGCGGFAASALGFVMSRLQRFIPGGRALLLPFGPRRK